MLNFNFPNHVNVNVTDAFKISAGFLFVIGFLVGRATGKREQIANKK